LALPRKYLTDGQAQRDRDIMYFPQTYDVFSFRFYFENKINETHGKTFSFMECLEEKV
jgi:hypothetical protein